MKGYTLAGSFAIGLWAAASSAQPLPSLNAHWRSLNVSQTDSRGQTANEATAPGTADRTVTNNAGEVSPPNANTAPSAAVEPTAAQPSIEPVEPVYVDEDRDKMRGLTVMAGGGVEGYTGDLASQINPGPGWSVTAAIKPTRVLGIEFGYNGAVNEVKGNGVVGLQGRGADIVRNGVDARATLALSATPVQPYILGGFGVSRYTVRPELRAAGFQSDTSERVPLGGGLRSHFGHFTADARFAYNFLINEGFASAVGPNNVVVNSVSAGAYQGTLQLGATF